MSSAPTASLLVLLVLAAVLTASAVAKVRNPAAVEDTILALRVPTLAPRRLTARLVPWVELALGLLLLLSPSVLLAPVAAIVVGLMVAYTWLIGRALTFEDPVDCACFGAIGSDRVGWMTLARNVLLVLLALSAIWIANRGGSASQAIGDLSADGWWTIVVGIAAITIAITIAGRPSDRASADTEPELAYKRQPIPWGVLQLHGGSSATLAELAATQARLLVVLSPHCGPCVRTGEKVDGWAERLGPAVGIVVVYPNADLELPHAPELAAVEPDENIRRVFSVGTPAAVLLGADGLMAGGPVAGERKVELFVEEILDELAPTGPGHADRED